MCCLQLLNDTNELGIILRNYKSVGRHQYPHNSITCTTILIVYSESNFLIGGCNGEACRGADRWIEDLSYQPRFRRKFFLNATTFSWL